MYIGIIITTVVVVAGDCFYIGLKTVVTDFSLRARAPLYIL